MIRIGIIGAGRMAAGHVDYFSAAPQCQVVAIADPIRERATSLAAHCGAQAVSDAADLIDQVDAVVIASPNALHHEQSVAAAQAGRHVYCEKPGGVSLAEARDIAEQVAKAGVVGAVGYSVRPSAQIRTMRQLQQTGRLGELTTIGSRRLWNMQPDQCPPWYAGLPGGHLLEISVHELDWMLALGGSVSSVHARAQDRGISGIDALWITINFASGAVGWHEGSWSTSLPMFFRTVEGTAGGAATDEWGSVVQLAQSGQDRATVPLVADFDQRGDFLQCIRAGDEPESSVGWNVTVMAVADAALRSIDSGNTELVEPTPTVHTASLWRDLLS